MIDREALKNVRHKEVLNAVEAARILMMDAHSLRVWIQRGNCPFGSYAKGNEKGQYFITKHQMLKHFGIKE